jgi:hypothetical protein
LETDNNQHRTDPEQQGPDVADEQYPIIPVDPAAEAFYSGALLRITRLMAVLAVVAMVPVTVLYGPVVGLGFAVGCVIAYVNFYYLKRVVSALADRVTATGQSESGRGILLRFLLRYALIAAAAYVIFRVSVASLYALLGGLFLPVAAIGCEAAYEAYVAVRKGL